MGSHCTVDGVQNLSYIYMSVCILALVTRHANRIFPVQHYIVIRGLSASIIFLNIIS